MTRRTFLPAAAAAAVAAQNVTLKGRLKQAVTRGVFARGMSLDDMAREAASRGIKGFDLIGPEEFPILKKHGLVPTMVPGGSTIPDGINTKANHDGIEKRMRAAITASAEAGAPSVIVLSGSRRGMSDEEGIDNSVAYFNRIKSMAEDKGVTLSLELLNSKVNHPDYHCDHTKWGVEIMKRVNSPRVKLLYDIYHMQIMEGDLIRTIRDNFQYLSHFHTGGNPGRNDIDESQEINYGAVARALADLNFTGYIAHEYRPAQGRDPLKSLETAIRIFDV